MSVVKFLSQLRKLNIRIWIEAGELRYQDPQGLMTAELLAEFQENQTEIMAFLKGLAYTPIEMAPRADYYPVTPVQKRFYILNQMEGAQTSYNMSGATVIEGKLEKDRLAETFQKLVARHEAFRTTFELVDGELIQRIHPEVQLPVDYQEVEERQIPLVIGDFIRPFDVGQPPLLRIKLLKVGAEKHILLYDMHHIISDALSMVVLMREFAGLYSGEALPELRVQYKDYAAWQNNQGKGTIAQQEKYWLNRFAGEIPVLDLPTDFPRAAVAANFEGETLDFSLSEATAKGLKQLTVGRKTTLFMTLLAGYNLLLSRLTGEAEIIVGTTVAGRQHADVKNMIGMFVNTLALKNHLGSGKTFAGFLDEVKQNALQAFENQDYQFEMLLEKLKIPVDPSHNPLFNTLFNPQDTLEDNYQFEVQGLKLSGYPLERKNSTFAFDLMLKFSEGENNIIFNCVYRTSLFKRSTIEYLMNEYLRLLDAIAADPERLLAEYPAFDPQNLQFAKPPVRIEAPFYEFPQEAIESSIVIRFEDQVRQYPNRLAAQTGSETISYESLNKWANQLGRTLLKNLTEKRPVALLLGNHPGLFAGIIGVLKAGQAYLPLDPSFPRERLAYMLSDSGATIVVADSEHLELALELGRKTEHPIQTIDLGQLDPALASDNLNLNIQPEQTAYIKYTSGSTGKPKGIPQTHRNVLAFIRRYTNELHINPADKVALFSSYSHSAGGIDIFSMLLNGGALYPYDLKSDGSLKKVTDWLIKEGITIFHSVPMVFRYCTESLAEGTPFGRIRLVVLGGEPITPQDVTRFKRYFSRDSVLVNMFGATEVIIGTFNLVSRETDITRALVPVGYPVEEVKTYLLNDRSQVVPVYGIGEIVYESEYLALDYLNLPEKSAAVYTKNPLTGTGRVFWSGDLGRMLPDGQIEFLGRKDFQVKIRGYRIELGEIEAAMDQIPGIHKSVVAEFKTAEGESYLAGYYTTTKEGLESKELRRILGSQLPEYMIPSHFIRLEELPLTPTGKLDRKALLVPEVNQMDMGNEYVAPRNDTEAKLVEIWQKILKVERIGIYDNFFELGGHSLKVGILANRIREKFGVEFKMSELFTLATILEESEVIERRRRDITKIENALQKIKQLMKA